jgi:hypothetical protein
MESNTVNPSKNSAIKIDHYLMTKLLGKGSSSIVKCKRKLKKDFFSSFCSEDFLQNYKLYEK